MRVEGQHYFPTDQQVISGEIFELVMWNLLQLCVINVCVYCMCVSVCRVNSYNHRRRRNMYKLNSLHDYAKTKLLTLINREEKNFLQ
jgi:hypothetical protein